MKGRIVHLSEGQVKAGEGQGKAAEGRGKAGSWVVVLVDEYERPDHERAGRRVRQ